MVTETKPETKAPDSEALAPPSDAQVVPPSTEEAVAQPGAEPEEKSTGEVAAVKEEAKPLDGPALQAKVDSGEVLTSTEKETLRRHNQAESDRAAYQAQVRQQQALLAQQEEARINGMWDRLGNDSLARFTEEMAAADQEGRAVSPTLLKHNIQTLVDEVKRDARAHFERPVWRDLATEVLQMAGDTPDNRDYISKQDIAGLRGLYRQLSFEQGRKTGPGEDGEFLTKKAKEKLIADAKKEAADELKSANPERFSNTSGTGGGSSSVSWKTKAEARTLHAKDLITNAQMRAINADPTIPEGY